MISALEALALAVSAIAAAASFVLRHQLEKRSPSEGMLFREAELEGIQRRHHKQHKADAREKEIA